MIKIDIDDVSIFESIIDDAKLFKYLNKLSNGIITNNNFYPDVIVYNKDYNKCSEFLQNFLNKKK